MPNDTITTRFAVDVSQLKKGISQANQQIKLANAQFKAATAGMDDWSKSAEGIQAKLKQLDSIIAAQKSKLQSYREQLERQQTAYDENGKRATELRKQMQDLAENGVDKTSKEYRLLEQQLASVEKEQESNKKSVDSLKISILDQEAAIGKSEKEFRNYEKELDNVESGAADTAKKTDELGDSVEKTGEKTNKVSSLFDSMEVALGNLVASGIQLAVKALKSLADSAVEAWKAFDDGRDVVVRLTGATGEFAVQMTTAYANVSKLIVADSQDIGKAVGEVQTRFGLTGDALESFALRYLQFAEITETDVIAAIDDTQKALSAYGLDVNSAKNLLDALAATSQKTGVDTATLTKGLISNGTAFQELGLSIEQSVSFMGELEKSGANSETVLNGMRKALKNATTDGKDLSTALLDLERDILNNTDSTKGLQAAYDVFGKSGDQIYGAVKNGSLSFRDIATAAENASGAVENTFNATKDATDDVKLSIQNLKASVAEVMDNFIQNNGDKISKILESLSGDGLPRLIDAIIKIGDSLVWVSDHFDTVAGVAKGAVDSIILPWKILWKYSVTVVKALIEGWDRFVAWITAAWPKIKETFAKVPQWFGEKFTQAWEAIKSAFSKIGEWFGEKWQAVKDAFSNAGEWFGTKFGEAWTNIKAAFSNIGEWFSGLWRTIKTKFTDIGVKIGDSVSSAVRGAVNGIITWVETTVNNAIRLINNVINLINKIPGVNIGNLSTVSIPRANGTTTNNVRPNRAIPVGYGTMMASGGVLEKGQIGILEGTGAEAVVPLENNRRWVAAVAASMSNEIGKAAEYNFTQNIYSPKPLSRIEIYRQTRNQINFAKMKAGV